MKKVVIIAVYSLLAPLGDIGLCYEVPETTDELQPFGTINTFQSLTNKKRPTRQPGYI